MAVGLSSQASLHPIQGVSLGTTSAGIKKPGRRDLVVMEISPGASCAAVFTQNAFCAAPVILAKRHLQRASPRYLLINTGYANAGTGEQGLADARACCDALAGLTGCSLEEVLPYSTGVIGEPLPVGRIQAGLPEALAHLSAAGWREAAHAIMTTDTVAKGASRQVQVLDQTLTVTGIAKGAGMICPNMATMLAFIATDVGLPPPLLQHCLESAVTESFNRITVDGDTSTNDACVLIATGQGTLRIGSVDHPAYPVLRQAVSEVCTELAQAIIRDGEGATKFITIVVQQGANPQECDAVAYAIAHSPLVKTAFFAGDPNWGRILAAIGRSGLAQLDVGGVSVYLDEVCVVRNGARAPGYEEAQGQAVMGRPEVTVRIKLGRGMHSARVWTCDLSYDYVRINAEYRS
jgi:glutamate N-acetyltransferase/amino-acid N-acetyltransferase